MNANMQDLLKIDILQGRCGAVLRQARYVGAAMMLFSVMVISVTASLRYGVLGTTKAATPPFLAFLLLMLPEMLREFRELMRSKVMLMTAVTLIISTGVWFSQGYSEHEPRLLFMFGVALMFPAATAWFRITGDRGMQLVFFVKLVVLAYACYLLTVGILQNLTVTELQIHPPIYRHIRHFNYDLALAIGLLGGMAMSKAPWVKPVLLLLFVILGWFTFWSGGRGQFLAMLVMLAVLLLTRRPSDDIRFAIAVIVAVFAGGFLVLISGETGMLMGSYFRTAKDSLNGASSGRLAIWAWTLSTAMQSNTGAIFGYGPESFVRMAVFQQFHHYITHPHNLFVQWVYEYGLIGVTMLVAAMASLAKRCLWPALNSDVAMARMCASTVVGMTVFSLVDGVYYHAAPLTFMTLLWAYLYSRQPVKTYKI